MRFPPPLVRGCCLARAATLKESFGLARRDRFGEGLEHTMIGRARAHAPEERASFGERDDQLLGTIDRPATRGGESADGVAPAARRKTKDRVGPKGRDHPAGPTRALNCLMVLE